MESKYQKNIKVIFFGLVIISLILSISEYGIKNNPLLGRALNGLMGGLGLGLVGLIIYYTLVAGDKTTKKLFPDQHEKMLKRREIQSKIIEKTTNLEAIIEERTQEKIKKIGLDSHKSWKDYYRIRKQQTELLNKEIEELKEEKAEIEQKSV